MRNDPTIIIGAGIGGLASAALLAARGVSVTVVESAAGPGGKACTHDVDGEAIDAGPTVFTLKPVFEALFEAAGANLSDYVSVRASPHVARHAWSETERLDLYADRQASADAIGDFAGAKEAQGFLSFSREAQRIYDILDRPFLNDSKPYPPHLMWRIGLWRVGDLIAIRPYESLWKVLKEHFRDPRLLQLFGRYTTYCGSSPFLTPATLMLIAHVESQGVWSIKGGMAALAKAIEAVAEKNGATFRYDQSVKRIEVERGRTSGVILTNGERLAASNVIFNGDPAALATGLLGPEPRRAVRDVPKGKRSLSALVWLVRSRASGFELAHHNVFFSPDYQAEFADLSAGRPPRAPTAYLCALDRNGFATPRPDERERMQIIVNAPPLGDSKFYDTQEKHACSLTMLERLAQCGLELERPLPHRLITPEDFAHRFPATGGALYGRASHGWAASFLRPGSRTRIPGLYCAGGATHPGAGVPMAALSGRLAAESLLADLGSTRLSRPRAIAGGTSTRSAMTGVSG